MDPVRNPFAPGAGSPPPELAGRQHVLDLAQTALLRVAQGRHAQSVVLTGLRGVGKTVLLNRIQLIAEDNHYHALHIEAHEDKRIGELLAPPLRAILFRLDQLGGVNERVKRALRVFRSFISSIKLKHGDTELFLDIEPERGTADSGDIEADLPELIAAVGDAAKARDKPVAILIDELQYLAEVELSALIMGAHRVSQRQTPLIVVGAGLPQVAGITGRSKSYAERLFNFVPLGPLADEDANTAIREPIVRSGERIDPDAVDEVIRQSQGYPYFLQDMGVRVLEHGRAVTH